MIKKLMMGLLILVLAVYFGMIIFFNSLSNPKSYHLEELDDFLEEIENTYHYVDKTSVKTLHSELIIKIEYIGHRDLIFDEAIYNDFKIFFMREEIKQAIIEKESGRIKYRQFPIIIVEFMDTVGTGSHYIKSPIEPVVYNVGDAKDDLYSHWSQPIYARRE